MSENENVVMTQERSLELAATAWCGENTKNKVMDPELAMEFAKILHREVNRRLFQDRLNHGRSTSDLPITPLTTFPVQGDDFKLLTFSTVKGESIPFPPEAITHVNVGDNNGDEASDH